jgi:hypothetical protein
MGLTFRVAVRRSRERRYRASIASWEACAYGERIKTVDEEILTASLHPSPSTLIIRNPASN